MDTPTPIHDLQTLLRSMEPELHDRVYAFVSLPPGQSVLEGVEPLASFREAEGLSLVLLEDEARAAGLNILFRCLWISLKVCSDLEAVGLTAAFASALAEQGIPSNVVAGAFHDHLFVPVDRADDAMAALRALQRRAAQS